MNIHNVMADIAADILRPARMKTCQVCQYCGGTDTYKNGYSPFCTETRFTCRECNEDTWQ